MCEVKTIAALTEPVACTGCDTAFEDCGPRVEGTTLCEWCQELQDRYDFEQAELERENVRAWGGR